MNALAKRKAAKRTVVSSIDLRVRRGMLCVRTKKSLYEGIAAVESCNDDFGARVVWMMPGGDEEFRDRWIRSRDCD